MPARSSPPRAISSTATSTDGSLSTIRVATGPVMSPGTVRWPSMYTPSVDVSPTWWPASFWMWASIRAVVVLPLVPVIAAIGIRLGVPGGNSMSITGPPTSRGRPSLGAMCIRNPGAALTSQMAPPISLYDSVTSVERKSTPPTSSPMAFTARTAISTLSGWTTSVTSVAVPPVERLPVDRRKTRSPSAGIVSRV